MGCVSIFSYGPPSQSCENTLSSFLRRQETNGFFRRDTILRSSFSSFWKATRKLFAEGLSSHCGRQSACFLHCSAELWYCLNLFVHPQLKQHCRHRYRSPTVFSFLSIKICLKNFKVHHSKYASMHLLEVCSIVVYLPVV